MEPVSTVNALDPCSLLSVLILIEPDVVAELLPVDMVISPLTVDPIELDCITTLPPCEDVWSPEPA